MTSNRRNIRGRSSTSRDRMTVVAGDAIGQETGWRRLRNGEVATNTQGIPSSTSDVGSARLPWGIDPKCS